MALNKLFAAPAVYLYPAINQGRCYVLLTVEHGLAITNRICSAESLPVLHILHTFLRNSQ